MEEVMVRCEALQQQVQAGAAAAAREATAAAAASRLLAGARGGGKGGGGGVSAARSAQLALQEYGGLAALLGGLLAGVPGQMADMFVVDTLSFLSAQLKWLDTQG
jgi:hypothetical protein